MNEKKLSERELDVMGVLWNAEKPMIIADIANAKEDLSISTVQVAVRNLLKKEYVEVADIVYSGRVLSRTFRPLKQPEDYFINEVKRLFPGKNENSRVSLHVISAMLNQTTEDNEILNQLEQMIEWRKKELGK